MLCAIIAQSMYRYCVRKLVNALATCSHMVATADTIYILYTLQMEILPEL